MRLAGPTREQTLHGARILDSLQPGRGVGVAAIEHDRLCASSGAQHVFAHQYGSGPHLVGGKRPGRRRRADRDHRADISPAARLQSARPTTGQEPLGRRDVGAEGFDSGPQMKSGASTSVIVLRSLIRTCSEGPAVSLNGSPTVSPTTAAACSGVPLPRVEPSTRLFSWPDSMYFLALSHAPPPLFSTVASRMPAMVPTIRNAAIASHLSTKPTMIGAATARMPGATISRSAALVEMSTHWR